MTSPEGPIGAYFMVRALAEGLSGVVATSARLDFTAEVSLDGQTFRKVPLRACHYVQEDKVTGFSKRVTGPGSGLLSGLVLSYQLGLEPQWRDAERLWIRGGGPGESPLELSVSGFVSQSCGPVLDQRVYLDQNTALRWLGAGASVTSIAIRLADEIDSKAWAAASQDSFRRFGLVLKPWDEVVPGAFPPRSQVLGPLEFVLKGLAFLALGGMFLVGLASRSPRSGLTRLLRGRLEDRVRALVLLVLVFLGALTALVACLNLSQTWWLSGGILSGYPFIGQPGWLWVWEPGLLFWPVLGWSATVLAILGHPQPQRGGSFR